MTCETITLPDGTRAIVCYRTRRGAPRRCQEPGCPDQAQFQCDFPIADGESCDRFLCARHAVPQRRNVHHCHGHHTDLFSSAGLLLTPRRKPVAGDRP